MDEAGRNQIHQELQVLNERGRYFWWWFKGERSYARLHRECRAFWVDLSHLEATSSTIDRTGSTRLTGKPWRDSSNEERSGWGEWTSPDVDHRSNRRCSMRTAGGLMHRVLRLI
jgi:hypothetical protein